MAMEECQEGQMKTKVRNIGHWRVSHATLEPFSLQHFATNIIIIINSYSSIITFNCSCTISFLFFLVHIHVCSMMLYCHYNQLYSSWANPLKTPNIQNLNFHLNSFHLQRFQNLNFHPLMQIQFA